MRTALVILVVTLCPGCRPELPSGIARLHDAVLRTKVRGWLALEMVHQLKTPVIHSGNSIDTAADNFDALGRFDGQGCSFARNEGAVSISCENFTPLDPHPVSGSISVAAQPDATTVMISGTVRHAGLAISMSDVFFVKDQNSIETFQRELSISGVPIGESLDTADPVFDAKIFPTTSSDGVSTDGASMTIFCSRGCCRGNITSTTQSNDELSIIYDGANAHWLI